MKYSQIKKYFYWETKDHLLLKIKEMSTSHLKNCRKMLYNKNYVSFRTLKFYLTCPPPNGEMAEYYFEQEFSSVLDKVPYLRLDIIERELKKREKFNV